MAVPGVGRLEPRREELVLVRRARLLVEARKVPEDRAVGRAQALALEGADERRGPWVRSVPGLLCHRCPQVALQHVHDDLEEPLRIGCSGVSQRYESATKSAPNSRPSASACRRSSAAVQKASGGRSCRRASRPPRSRSSTSQLPLSGAVAAESTDSSSLPAAK